MGARITQKPRGHGTGVELHARHAAGRATPWAAAGVRSSCASGGDKHQVSVVRAPIKAHEDRRPPGDRPPTSSRWSTSGRSRFRPCRVPIAMASLSGFRRPTVAIRVWEHRGRHKPRPTTDPLAGSAAGPRPRCVRDAILGHHGHPRAHRRSQLHPPAVEAAREPGSSGSPPSTCEQARPGGDSTTIYRSSGSAVPGPHLNATPTAAAAKAVSPGHCSSHGRARRGHEQRSDGRAQTLRDLVRSFFAKLAQQLRILQDLAQGVTAANSSSRPSLQLSMRGELREATRAVPECSSPGRRTGQRPS